MKRRTWAGLLAVVLVLGLAVVAAREPVPYVTFAPGPTVNVLGKFKDKSIVTVSGHKAYKDDGGLRLVTVIPSGPDEKISIPQLVSAWVDPDRGRLSLPGDLPEDRDAGQRARGVECADGLLQGQCRGRRTARPGHPVQDRGEDLGRHQGWAGRREAEGRRPGAVRERPRGHRARSSSPPSSGPSPSGRTSR